MKMLINGQPADAKDGAVIDVINPANLHWEELTLEDYEALGISVEDLEQAGLGSVYFTDDTVRIYEGITVRRGIHLFGYPVSLVYKDQIALPLTLGPDRCADHEYGPVLLIDMGNRVILCTQKRLEFFGIVNFGVLIAV